MSHTETRTAVLLMAYGTPHTRSDIGRYYTDIRRGHPPTAEQLANLTARYDALGGTSPLAARTEAQRHGLQKALDDTAPSRFDVVLGLKHADPSIEAAIDDLAAQGYRRVVALVLAPHYSAYSVGQYLDRARAAAAPHGIEVRSIESWATLPEFVTFVSRDLAVRRAAMPERTQVYFTAHSLPERIITAGDPYTDEVRATADAVASKIGWTAGPEWTIAWQSAGRTPEPWLGPDILEAIDQTADTEPADGATHGVLVSAIGFVSDHLEVLYDLDIEAADRASRRGLAFDRTACVNDDPTVMSGLARLVIEAGSS